MPENKRNALPTKYKILLTLILFTLVCYVEDPAPWPIFLGALLIILAVALVPLHKTAQQERTEDAPNKIKIILLGIVTICCFGFGVLKTDAILKQPVLQRSLRDWVVVLMLLFFPFLLLLFSRTKRKQVTPDDTQVHPLPVNSDDIQVHPLPAFLLIGACTLFLLVVLGALIWDRFLR